MSNNIPGQFTSSNPEGVVEAPKGARFFRDEDNFFLSYGGQVRRLNVNKKAFLYGSYNNPLFPFLKEDAISFSTPYESWIKVGDGINKTGWRKIGTSRSFVTIPVVAPEPIMGDIEATLAGSYFSLFLKTNGDLWVAGQNSDGQLGIGFTSERESASLALTDVSFGSAGCYSYHAAVVKNDGTLWFSGRNSSGQFGDGTYDSVDVWTMADLQGDITGSSGIKEVGVSDTYTAILFDNGNLWLAGEDLGLTSTTFVQIASDVATFSAGGYHLLYVKNDGVLYGIGDNGNGQLGTSSSSYYNYDVPYQIDTNVKSAFAGGYHSGYIKNDDTLWMTGANGSSQLGNRSLTDVFIPFQLDTNVKAVSCGDSHTLYLNNDDDLYVIGTDSSAQLGMPDYWDVRTPLKIRTGIKNISCGYEHSLIVNSENYLYGAGYNYYLNLSGVYHLPVKYYTPSTGWTSDGVTGFELLPEFSYKTDYDTKDCIYADGKFIIVGGTNYGPEPYHNYIKYSYDAKQWYSASLPPNDQAFQSIVYGNNIFLANTENSEYVFKSTDGINWTSSSFGVGKLFMWNGTPLAYGNGEFIATGEKQDGNFVILNSTDGENWNEQPNPFNYIYSGSGYPCRTAGPYYLNGEFIGVSTFNGELDQRSLETTRSFNFVRCFEDDSYDGISSFAGTQLLTKNGTVYGFGNNQQGKAGVGWVSNFDKPVYTGMTNVRSTSGGFVNTSFVKNDDTLWVVGDNTTGQLGIGFSSSDGYGEYRKPFLLDTNVTQSLWASSGFYQNTHYYVKTDGTLLACGLNYNNIISSSGDSFSTPTHIDSNVKQVSAGNTNIAYIKNDNTLWAKGANTYGQLGNGTTASTTSSVQVDTNVRFATSGYHSTFYIKNDDTLWGTGIISGSDSSFYSVTSPVQIASNIKYVSKSQNSHNTIYVTNDGAVYCTGVNSSGQLGMGYTSSWVSDFQLSTITSGAKQVISQQYYSIVIKNDNTIYTTNPVMGTYVNKNLLMRSSDGVTWTTGSAGFYVDAGYSFRDMAYGNGKYVAIHTNGAISYSEDANNWTYLIWQNTNTILDRPDYSAFAYRIIFDGTKFVVPVSSEIGYNLATSTDGINWTFSKEMNVEYNPFFFITQGAEKYAAFSLGSYNDYSYAFEKFLIG
jgi:alpha-tubulin suppressor-like RCC1 family protein